MRAMAKTTGRGLLKLASADLRNISRDPTLLGVMVMSILLILVFLVFEDQMNEAVLSAFSLTNFSDYIVPLVLIIPAYLIGWIIGFLILEERDEGPLLALDVTPLGKQGVAIYRATLAFFLTLIVVGVAIPFLLPPKTIQVVVTLLVFTALQSSIVSFAIPSLANNKIQGLALTKVTNLFSFVLLLTLFPTPWRYLAGFIPSFWIGEMLHLSTQQYLPQAIVIILGQVCHILVLIYFYNRLRMRSA